MLGEHYITCLEDALCIWHYSHMVINPCNPCILGLVLFHRKLQEVNLPKSTQLVSTGAVTVPQQSESDIKKAA